MIGKTIIACLMASLASAQLDSYGAGSGQRLGSSSGGHKGMPYSFSYDVNDDQGNDYGHREESDGSVVNGQYRVLLPDGRVQVVTYTADHAGGYQATVEYQGEASFPPAPRPLASRPRPAASKSQQPSGQYNSGGFKPSPSGPTGGLPSYGFQ